MGWQRGASGKPQAITAHCTATLHRPKLGLPARWLDYIHRAKDTRVLPGSVSKLIKQSSLKHILSYSLNLSMILHVMCLVVLENVTAKIAAVVLLLISLGSKIKRLKTHSHGDTDFKIHPVMMRAWKKLKRLYRRLRSCNINRFSGTVYGWKVSCESQKISAMLIHWYWL